jgi:adenine-specific DNA methylase
MEKDIFLDIRLYETLLQKLLRNGLRKKPFSEKEMQIVLGNVLHNNFKIKRIFNESKYRYYDESRGYFSDKETDLCRIIRKKQEAKRCDLRLLSPPAWVELKLDKIPDEKDLDNLFGSGSASFKNDESRYSISVWRKRKVNNVEKDIEKLKQGLPTEAKSKTFQTVSGVVVAVLYLPSK